VLWLSVRPAAADPHWLAQALLDSLHNEGLTPASIALSGDVDAVSWHLNTLPVIEDVVSTVAEPFVLIVDGADAMSGACWESLVESLAGSLPEGATMAMSTREAVPTTLWRLHARGLVHVVGPDVLAFDEDEAAQLIERLGVEMQPDQVKRLVAETEGWPVALYLVGLASGSPTLEAPASAAGIAGWNEYLRADIVGRLSSEDARFLARASVLSSLDPEACDAVTGARDSLARLRRLSADNHLLAAQDVAQERFRLHPLLAQFLNEDLRERDRGDWQAAHRRASLVREQRRDLDSAVHHAKLSGDDDRLGELIWSHTAEMLGYGRWAVVQRWLGGLSEHRVGGHCGLALGAAWAAIQAGDVLRASHLALDAWQRAADVERSYLPDVELLEATIGASGLDGIESSARSFIASRSTHDRWLSLAYFLLGVSLVLRDRTAEGVDALDEGYRRAGALDVPLVKAHCLAGLADAALLQEDEEKALSHIRELRALATTHRLDAVATSAPLYTTSTTGYLIEGRFADARREAARALRLTALMKNIAPWHAVQGRLALARVNLALGDPDRAKVLLDEAGDARGPANASPVLDRMFHENEERLSKVATSLVGAASLTTAEVRVLQYLPTHMSFPEIAEELVVSRHTVKTQAMSAYRKLGVHTRTQAIERARRAGLLPPSG
jgi:LuxR family transcriptional regulator, maltose regulon positive regulatory protein